MHRIRDAVAINAIIQNRPGFIPGRSFILIQSIWNLTDQDKAGQDADQTKNSTRKKSLLFEVCRKAVVPIKCFLHDMSG